MKERQRELRKAAAPGATIFDILRLREGSHNLPTSSGLALSEPFQAKER